MLKDLELGPEVSRIHRIRLNRTSICDIFIPAGKIGSCTPHHLIDAGIETGTSGALERSAMNRTSRANRLA